MMRPGIFRIVALLLVVLGASPFTAPFSVLELPSRSGDVSDRQHQNERHRPSNDHGRHGAVLKTARHLTHGPIVAPTAVSFAPIADHVSLLAALPAASVSSRRVPIQILRI